jgi:lipoate-protein ligase A
LADHAYPSYAYDDDLIEAARCDGQTRVRVYRLTDTVVVLGSGSRPEVELRLDACEADDVPILRRRGGGCSVVLDPGNVIVSVVATGQPFGRHRQQFDTLTAWLIGGLARSGMPGVRQAGTCDLVLGDKKVGGACLHRARDVLYYSVSLLVEPDIEKVNRYLKHPPREPEYRQGRSHCDFMGSLASFLAVNPSCGHTADEARTGHPTDAAIGDCAALVASRLRHALQPPKLPPVSRGRVGVPDSVSEACTTLVC